MTGGGQCEPHPGLRSFLEHMTKIAASDLYVSVGSPPLFRVDDATYPGRVALGVEDVAGPLDLGERFRRLGPPARLASGPADAVVEGVPVGADEAGRPRPAGPGGGPRRRAGHALAEDRATIDRLMRSITPREREVLRLRFEEDLTQAEIGELIGVSQMQVSRLLRKAIHRLRRHMLGS